MGTIGLSFMSEKGNCEWEKMEILQHKFQNIDASADLETDSIEYL